MDFDELDDLLHIEQDDTTRGQPCDDEASRVKREVYDVDNVDDGDSMENMYEGDDLGYGINKRGLGKSKFYC